MTIKAAQLTCYPRPSAPCSVGVEAEVSSTGGASNSTGDLTYAWSGCASGTAKTASCVIERPGDVAVTVRVTDRRGPAADATVTATGTNQPPVVTITNAVMWESWYPSSGGGSFEVSARVADPERPTTSDCGTVATRSVTASGVCYGAYYRCFCGTMDIGALKNAQSGECTLTLTALDEWGLTTTTTRSFNLPTVHVVVR